MAVINTERIAASAKFDLHPLSPSADFATDSPEFYCSFLAARWWPTIFMINGLNQIVSSPVLEQMLNFTEARHNVLAGNIANLDTPGYKARDMSPALFQQQLKDAIEARDAAESEGLDAGDDGSSTISDPVTNMDGAFETMLRHDGGNVTLEGQVAELTKNQMQYNTALALLTSQFHSLEAAISEQA